MTHTDPIQELNEALSVAPSPDFTARVRQHIASPVRTDVPAFRGLAAAAVVVLIASTLVARWPRPTDQTTTSTPARMAVAAPPTASSLSASPTQSTAALTASVRAPVPRGGVAAQSAAPSTSNQPFAETLVPDDQRLALVRLLGSIRAGQGAVPDLVLDEVVDDEGRWTPRALVIEPLKVQPIK